MISDQWIKKYFEIGLSNRNNRCERRGSTLNNRNHNPDYNKKHYVNQLVIRLPKLITNVNKSNKAMLILRTVAKSLHYLKTNLTTYENGASIF